MLTAGAHLLAPPASGPQPVTICVPVYNGARYLRQCLESALNQTFATFELLIVDDRSTDTSAAIAAEYARSDPRIRFVINPVNAGLVENWNRCVELASGEWIKFLFHDDFLGRTCLEKMLGAVRSEVSLVVCRRTPLYDEACPPAHRLAYEHYAATHNLARRFPGSTLISAEEFAEAMVDHPTVNCIGEPTATLIRRSAFERFGTFSTDLIHSVDWEFMARVALQTGLCYLNEPLATFRVHGDSATARNWATRRWRREAVDPVLILREMVYGRLYERVRRVARRRRPPVDLRLRLVENVQTAARLAAEADMLADWRNVLRRYPELSRVPATYRAKSRLKKYVPASVVSALRWLRGA